MAKEQKTKKHKKNLLEVFEARQTKKKLPELRTGDTVRVHAKIKEGDKERIQIFEGIITRYTRGKHRTAITVRKVSFGVGVERVFPILSPSVDRVERLSIGKVRRARLYYLRERKGKAARIESELADQEAQVVESLGTVASGPVIEGDESKTEKKAGAVVEAARKG